MISYKNWKVLNESLDGFHTLGLVQQQNLGIVSNIPTQDELLAEMKKKMAECKKKMKKKMGIDGEELVPKKDGEIVPPAEKKDADPDADEEAEKDSEGEHEEPDGDEDESGKEPQDGEEGEEGGEGDEKLNLKKKPSVMDDAGHAREMMMKKKMKKDGKEAKKEDKKDDKDDKGKECKEKEEKVDKKDKKEDKEDKKKAKKIKEDEDWHNSVSNMLKEPQYKFWDGFKAIEPVAGEVGFAPEQRIGSF